MKQRNESGRTFVFLLFRFDSFLTVTDCNCFDRVAKSNKRLCFDGKKWKSGVEMAEWIEARISNYGKHLLFKRSQTSSVVVHSRAQPVAICTPTCCCLLVVKVHVCCATTALFFLASNTFFPSRPQSTGIFLLQGLVPQLLFSTNSLFTCWLSRW